jgi:hypothetical protein
MGLTRLRAEQIGDIDYKQAVRVITTTDITLSGGAPNQVDGVNLSVDDRILVTGQSVGNQNGIYQVQTVGTGSSGTWIRSLDTNATGELQAGTIVMVTEGTVYADTQWKLTTNNPIVIGTTPLTFEQNSAYAFGNIYANGTAVLANSVGSTVTFTAGNNIAITGNNTSKTVTIGVTGFDVSSNSISNGTSNVNVVSSGGNITVGVGGTANVVVVATTGQFVTGVNSVTGNIDGGNIRTAGLVSATGNITTAGQFIGAGTGLTGTAASLTAGSATSATTAGTVTTAAQPNITSVGTLSSVSVTGNVQSGNINAVGGNLTGNVSFGNIFVGGYYYANGIPFTGGGGTPGGADTQIQFNDNGLFGGSSGLTFNKTTNAVATTGTFSATGNVTGGNLLTAGSISATGNITGLNLNSSSADLAEKYVSDSDYDPGTVVEFGGANEITISTQSHSTQVAGIVSTSPGYLMNVDLVDEHVTAVALTGRVPCQVVGTIAKGDRLVSSNLPGVAQRLNLDQYEPGCIIGKALETYDSTQPGTIEVAVGRF